MNTIASSALAAALVSRGLCRLVRSRTVNTVRTGASKKAIVPDAAVNRPANRIVDHALGEI